MKIGLMSDSHGNTNYVKKAAGVMKRKGVELIIHLGDNYVDANEIYSPHPTILKVPGVFSDEYQNHAIKNRIVKDFGGVKVLVTHTLQSHENDLPNDLKPEEFIEQKKVDVIFYGHTHLWEAKEENGILFVNPGHLKTEDKHGRQATFALIDIEGKKVKVRIVGINDKVEMEKEFEL